METQQSPHRPSPNTPSTSGGGGSSGNNNNNNNNNNNLTSSSPPASALPPLTPKPIPRTEANPYPTTFIQADTTSFKQVVQMLTGSTETAAKASVSPMPHKSPTHPAARPKKPSFKLYERRGSFRHLKTINPLLPNFVTSHPSPRNQHQPEILSPSMLDLPSLVLSPVTPLISDPFHRCSSASEEEERVLIAEKGFYLHPSPRSASDPPPLLPLFPVTSPRLSPSFAAGVSP